MSKVNAFVSSWQWLAFITLLAGAALLATLWPVTWWLDVRQVKVSDGPWPPVMVVDRTINRDFYGRYNVAIYRYHSHGWEAVCTAEKSRLYRAGAVLPEALTLEWWADGGDCTAAKLNVPGRYNMRTQWTVQGWWFLPDKEVHALSNIWLVP